VYLRGHVADETHPLTKSGRIRRGPPVGRHVAAVAVVLVLILVFWLRATTSGYDVQHISNVVMADTSFVLLCLVLMLGPGARFVPRLRRLVPWGRELGIGMFVTASLHVVLLIDGYLGPGQTLFSFRNLRESFFGPYGYIAADDLWTAANWVGLFALGYALVLAGTSNDFSQRLLGRGWKFTQRQTYTLFVLVWLHTAVFLVDLDRFPPALTWFWVFTILVVVAQMSGFVHTVRSTRGPSPQRAPTKTRAASTKVASVVAAKWIAVAALWGLLIIGIYPLGLV
jgi:sulfoxide reductase heme-binding subunit YedZ